MRRSASLRGGLWTGLVWLISAAGAGAVTLEVHNTVGGVNVLVDPEARLKIEGMGSERSAQKDDIQIVRQAERMIVRCEPPDGEKIDLDIQLPFGFQLDVTTDTGPIAVKGMLRSGRLQTNTGAIRLSAPWRATRLQVDAETEPASLETPKGIKFSQKKIAVSEKRTIWRLRDRLAERAIVYGRFSVKAASPQELHLTDFEIPASYPVKIPWQAPAILDEILSAGHTRPPPGEEWEESRAPVADAGKAVFRSDVRMVNLIVTVNDQEGRPVTNLSGGDFEVVEAGVPQTVTFAGSDEVPFNLAMLLDLSGSTRPDRASMRQAAERFVSLAGPRDKIAIYALADDLFHVISLLTADRRQLMDTIQRVPNVSGATPLYDAVVLAYAEELHELEGERNALIVISDGIDNQLSRQEAPSQVKFKKLLRAAGEMNAIIYPVFLLSGERFGRGWSAKARRRMEQLAEASGGRVFPAQSIRDLEPVFPQLGAELRGVYSVAYYPENQSFDGGWRGVQVKVNRPGVVVRSRAGYYAR